MSDEPPDLYVSAVQGHLVSRPGSSVIIGATRDIREPTKGTWHTDLVVKIPEAELRAYRREYDRALRGGSLTKRTKADFEACCSKLEATAKADADKAKAEAATPKTGKKE